jgi:hypothetical protein
MANDQDLRPIFMDDQGKMKYRGDDGRLYYLNELGEPVSRWSYYFGHTVLVVASLVIATVIVCGTAWTYNHIVKDQYQLPIRSMIK